MSTTSFNLQRADGEAKPPNKLRIRVLNDLDELEKLRLDWQELLSHYPQASIFSTWEWLAPWWRAFGADRQLYVITFENASSRLVALAPLALTTRKAFGRLWKVVCLMGDGSHDSDNLDLPILPGYEEDVLESLLDHLEERPRLWDFCEWNTFPQNSSTVNRVPSYLKRRNWPYEVGSTPCSAINLPASFNAYLMQLSAKERAKIGIRTRRLEKLYEVQYHRCCDIDDTVSCLETLFELHRLRWNAGGEPGSFGLPARRQFYHDLTGELLRRNQLQFWLLQLNGKAAAAQFGFRFEDTVYSLQEGYDPAFAKDSVGFVLRGHVLCQLIKKGVRRYDFLGGVNESKTRWGAEVSSYANLCFSRARSVGSAYILGKRRMKDGKEWLRAHVPQRAWALLHLLNHRLRGGAQE
jgi:Acetyltransferase (GNAT) domain